ncbi:DUF4396 domain-containing protein [Streptomyces sp. NBC_00536]|uniref:DUF4396 domain-containing protein n=1 Tax=Streptomyces sp. NBC_00536 TaxID=2975769 RepID=UPI002E8182BB|nr:DUF4396 domain-containing protein [Streptomyces sp. NBC_00536]WUC77400.1 DUF4396 domain-containing protein [Streptomyces sp. NBC_00536]
MDHSTHEHGTHEHEAHEHEAHQAHTGHGDHAGHAGHAGHSGHAGHQPGGVTWGAAAQATVHCLTGCAIGDILGMAVGTALGWGNAPTMILAIVLAFVFGYSLTLFGIRKAGLDFKSALKIALAADTVSIIVMELVDNGIVAVVPGAMDAQLNELLFWTSLLGGFVIAFLLTTPVNKWLIGRGKGHAVVHAYH